jgi:hypothetical protein
MKRSRSFLVSLAAAVSLAASVFACAFECVRERVVDGFRAVVRLLFGAPAAPVVGDKADTRTSRLLTAASSFVKRLVKRERPRIEARWAMCPSI